MAQQELEGRLEKSERSVQSFREKLLKLEKSMARVPELEKSMALMTRNVERLFESMEENRQVMETNTKALANFAAGLGKEFTKGNRETGKRKAPESEGEASGDKDVSRIEGRGERNDEDSMIRHKFKKVDVSTFDGEHPDD